MEPRVAATVLIAAVMASSAAWESDALLRSFVFNDSALAESALMVVVSVEAPLLVPSPV